MFLLGSTARLMAYIKIPHPPPLLRQDQASMISLRQACIQGRPLLILTGSYPQPDH